MGRTVTGEANALSRLSDDDVRQIRIMRSEGLTYIEIAQQFDCSDRQISRICRGKSRLCAGGDFIDDDGDVICVQDFAESAEYPPSDPDADRYFDRCPGCGHLYCGPRCHACYVRALE